MKAIGPRLLKSIPHEESICVTGVKTTFLCIQWHFCIFSAGLASSAGTSRNQSQKPKARLEEDYDTTDQCPEPDGYFADAEQCDKYYQCASGAITEKLCPDGMVFNDYSHEYEKCDLPFNIDCSQRPKLRKYCYGSGNWTIIRRALLSLFNCCLPRPVKNFPGSVGSDPTDCAML